MCPIPPTATFESIIGDQSLPQGVRSIAQDLLVQANVQPTVIEAVTKPGVISPPTGNTQFACSIYSFNNDGYNLDYPDKPGYVKYPGTLVQDSKNFIVKNADGTVQPDLPRTMCYENFEKTWQFYKKCFNRNSIDDNGLEIVASIHYQRGYANAFWSSDISAMVFGDAGRWDGRGWLVPDMSRFKEVRADSDLITWLSTYSLDITGHELTHGVVSATAGLGKQDRNSPAGREALTLNEHIADCFGIMLKHYSTGQTAVTGSWDVAPGWWAQSMVGVMNWTANYMRTFRKPDPNTSQPDSSPKHMDDLSPWKDIPDPHNNMGILNHAFYLAAQAFKGNTWENVGKIWYAALTDQNFKSPTQHTFVGWAMLTTKYAKEMFPTNGESNMKTAWQTVGITI